MTRRRFPAWLVAALLLPATVSPAFAGPVEDARAALEAGEYANVDKALKSLLEQSVPPVEALEISLEAAIADGRVVTAQRRVTRLLKVVPEPSPELLHRAAVVAERAGEDRLALSRHLSYSEAVTGASAQLEHSLRYLLQNGAYPDSCRKYVGVFGTTSGAWTLCRSQLDRLLMSGDSERGMPLAEFIMSKWNNPLHVGSVHARLREAASNYQLGREVRQRFVDPLRLMLRFSPDNAAYAESMYWDCYRHIGVAERVELLFALHDMAGAPLSSNHVYHFSYMRDLPTEEARIAAGKRFLALEKLYRDSGTDWHYREYMRHLCESPQVFAVEGKELLGSDELLARFDELARRYADMPSEVTGQIANIAMRFLDGDARAAFLRKHLALLEPRMVWELARAEGMQDYEATFAGAAESKSYKYKVDLAYYLIDAHNSQKNYDALLDAAREYCRAWPSRFSSGHLRNHVALNSNLSVQQRVDFFRGLYEQAGYTDPLKNCVNEMARRKEFANDGEFQAFKTAFEAKNEGADEVMKALVTIDSLSGNREIKKQAAHRIAREFLDSYEGRVPGSWDDTSSREDLAALALLEKHHQTVGDHDEEDGPLFALLWAPRLGGGPEWNEILNALRWLRGRSGVLHDVGKHYVKLLDGEFRGTDYQWSILDDAVAPEGSGELPFKPYYDDMGLANAFDYVSRQERSMQPQAVFDELARISEMPGFQFRDRGHARWALDYLFGRAHGSRKPSPALVSSAWQALLADEDATGDYDAYGEHLAFGIYQRSGQAEALQAHWQALQAALDRRTPVQRVETAARALSYMPRESDAELKPGHRLHAVLKVLGPLYLQLEPSDWSAVLVTNSVVDELNRVRDDHAFEPLRDEALALGSQLVCMLHGGARYDGWGSLQANYAGYAARTAMASGDWGLASVAGRLAAIELRREDNWGWNVDYVLKPTLAAAEEAGAHELAYVFIDAVLRHNNTPESVSRLMAMERARFGRAIPDLIPVPRTDPTYDLHQAARSLAIGNEERAWQLTAPKLVILKRSWIGLEPEYVVWCAQQMRRQKMLKEGMELVSEVLLREEDLGPETAAGLLLAQGDLARDMQNYQLARLTYEGLMANKRYVGTMAADEARYSLISLHILTRNYADAERLLERMADSGSVETQANAYCYYARIAYSRKEFEQSRDYLAEVFKRRNDHQDARLLEGELRLHLPRGLESTEVAVGNPELQTVAIPGQLLRLKLHDTNLSIARGGASIPVVARTTSGGDEEHIELHSSRTEKNLFEGSIPTALGEIKRNNYVLEIGGRDNVTYMIEPAFQEDNDLDYPAKTLLVKSEARLAASPGEILSKEEEEERELQRNLDQYSLEGRLAMLRESRTVRPGSPIYVQVTDFDRDMSGEADTIPVELSTTSGDILSAFLATETGPHTGIFQGAVPTGIPFPKASASDTEEGLDPNVVINSTREGVWRSLPDGQKPKWLVVDSMDSYEIATATLKVVEPGAIRRLRLLGMLADDYDELAVWPEGAGELTGGATVTLVPDRKGVQAWQVRNYVQTRGVKAEWEPVPHFDRSVLEPDRRRDDWCSFRVRGTFYLPENRIVDLRFIHDPSPRDWQYAYLFVDGQMVLGGKLNAQTIGRVRSLTLTKGAHRMEIVGTDRVRDAKVTVGYRTEAGEFDPLPEQWFSVTENAELASYLRPKGKIELEDGVFVATIEGGTRVRRVQWVFDDFTGQSVAVESIQVTDAAGGRLLPVETDFAAGMRNDILEISPGDHVTVVYRDEKRLREDQPELTETLSASYCNGSVQFAEETFIDAGNRTWSEWRMAKRCHVGDTLSILVEDYDEDLTEERDSVNCVVTTSAGERLELKALETMPTNRQDDVHEHAGFFFQTLKIGDQTGGNTIKAAAGEKITVTYNDRENTVPGVPFERTYTLSVAGGGEPEMLVYQTASLLVEDRSPSARKRLERLQMSGLADDEEALLKEQVFARHPHYEGNIEGMPPFRRGSDGEWLASVGAPLLVEVVYPEAALNEGSAFTITAVSESELQAARDEGREPRRVEVPLVLDELRDFAADKGYDVVVRRPVVRTPEQMLEDGVFVGVVRLQMGSPNDPVDDLVVTDAEMFREADQSDGDREPNRVPTVIVSGSDLVHLEAMDVDGKNSFKAAVRLLSDARLRLMDRTYAIEREKVHVGERFFVELNDPDSDLTDQRDAVQVVVQAADRPAATVTLTESLPHSGVFTGTVKPEFFGKAAAAESAASGEEGAPLVLPVNFGDDVTFQYEDARSLASTQPRQVKAAGKIHFGSDGQVAVFTKQFKDPEMAVKTRFLMAEALFEMAKEHRKLEQTEVAEEEIARGKRILEEAMRDYPDTSLAAHGEYLLANLAQELENYREAINRYNGIIKSWPDSPFAPRSQHKKAICLEKLENFDQASEEYVRLTYIYPDHELVPDAMLRLANHYYKSEQFKVAAKVFAQFQERHKGHRLASRALFLSAQCWMKLEDLAPAVEALEKLIEAYPDDKDVRAEAMYWLGDVHTRGENYQDAYRTFKKLTWDYPESKWAKIARGRLTEEVFLNYVDE